MFKSAFSHQERSPRNILLLCAVILALVFIYQFISPLALVSLMVIIGASFSVVGYMARRLNDSVSVFERYTRTQRIKNEQLNAEIQKLNQKPTLGIAAGTDWKEQLHKHSFNFMSYSKSYAIAIDALSKDTAVLSARLKDTAHTNREYLVYITAARLRDQLTSTKLLWSAAESKSTPRPSIQTPMSISGEMPLPRRRTLSTQELELMHSYLTSVSSLIAKRESLTTHEYRYQLNELQELINESFGRLHKLSSYSNMPQIPSDPKRAASGLYYSG